MEMPSGGMHMSEATGAVWSKMPNNFQLLHFLRIPDPKQARVMNLFGDHSTIISSSAPSTTIPKTNPEEEKK